MVRVRRTRRGKRERPIGGTLAPHGVEAQTDARRVVAVSPPADPGFPVVLRLAGRRCAVVGPAGSAGPRLAALAAAGARAEHLGLAAPRAASRARARARRAKLRSG